jgi:hypothetical protein
MELNEVDVLRRLGGCLIGQGRGFPCHVIEISIAALRTQRLHGSDQIIGMS